jgi:hypothetical protein
MAGAALAACLWAPSLFAQVTPAAGYTPPDDTPSVKVGGVIFTDFTYQDEPTVKDADGNSIHPTPFNVARAYVNVTGNISHLVSFRITPDVSRETGTGSSLAGSLNYRLKYAYGQVSFDDFATKGGFARIGVQQTPYIDYMESLYRYRFQGTTFSEREGFLTSSDFGLATRLVFPGNYGDIHVGVYNGDGYSRAEANDQKALQVRASLRPMPLGGNLWKGLRFAVFYDADRYVKSGERNRFIANSTYEHKWVNIGVEYLTAKDQTSVKTPEVKAEGYSLFVLPRFKPVGVEGKAGLEGLFRYDTMKPSKSVDAKRHRTIVGLAYWFPVQKGVSAALLADTDRATFDKALNRANEVRYSLHALFTF